MAKSRYYILGEVGQGQFGKVFCASDRQTGELVALKSLDHRRFTTQQFLREIAVLVRLRHPNIVSFHALEYNDTGRYIVMDYCQGGTLRQLMETKQSPTLVQKLTIVRDVLLGLEYAHGHHVIHCDLKPENILLNVASKGWTAQIADFGISQFQEHPQTPSKSEGHTGSPAYMAPERFYGEYSPESDLYAIGVLLFELMMGKRPFSGMPADVMKGHLNQPLRIPTWVPTLLKAILQKSLQKLPQHRYGSAREMYLALETAIATLEHAEAQPPSLRSMGRFTGSDNPRLTAYSSREGTAWYQKQGNATVPLKQVQLGMEQLKPCLTLESPIKTPIRKLWVRPQGCFIATAAAQGWTISLMLPDGPCQTLGMLPTLPEGSVEAENFRHSCLDIDPQGRWLAIAAPREPAHASLQSPVVANQLEVYRLSSFQSSNVKPIAQALLKDPIQHLWWSSSRHLLLATTGLADSPQSQLQFWNRQGQFYWSYPLPTPLQEGAVSVATPGSLFAIAADPHCATQRICLRPFKIQQMPLDIEPMWMGAFQWGYVLLTTPGTIVCLNRRGKPLLELNLPHFLGGTMSAIAVQAPATLWIATKGASEVMLYTLDLSPHLPKSMGRIRE